MSVRKQKLYLLFVVGFILSLVLTTLPSRKASAAQLTARSMTLQAGATDGGSMPSGVVRHHFAFTIPTGGNVGSIKFEYCTIASGTCTTPTGLSTTSATLVNETGATGFTIVNTTQGAPYLTRTAANISASTAVTYTLGAITNPSTTNYTFYVRISTHVSTDTTGGSVDTGTVAASTATQIVLTGTMPESLIFCTGGTITDNVGGIPDCSTATSGAISFNQLFSPQDTAYATSQMAASTNAASGYSITVNGATLTSGSNTITAMAAAAVIAEGVGQFGLNLKDNAAPNVGAEVDPVTNGTNFKGQAKAGYNTVDQFKFVTGETVAASDNTGAGPTDAQTYTVSYIVNVPGSQPPGTYTSTLTYICTATF